MVLATWSSQPSREIVEGNDHIVKFQSKVHMTSSARAVGRVREKFPEVILKLKSDAGVIRQTGGRDRPPDRGKPEARRKLGVQGKAWSFWSFIFKIRV